MLVLLLLVEELTRVFSLFLIVEFCLPLRFVPLELRIVALLFDRTEDDDLVDRSIVVLFRVVGRAELLVEELGRVFATDLVDGLCVL